MKKDSVCILEFPYLINLIKKYQIDTVYHEHYSYISFLSLENLLKKTKIGIFDLNFEDLWWEYKSFFKNKEKISKNEKIKIHKILNHEKKNWC